MIGGPIGWPIGGFIPAGEAIAGVRSVLAFWIGGASSPGGVTPPPPGGGIQFLIAGPDITEQFVTHGGISAMNVCYTINPLSRRTV